MITLVDHDLLSPVPPGRTAVVRSDPIMSGVVLHYQVLPKFLPYQGTSYSTCQEIHMHSQTLHQEQVRDLERAHVT